MIARAHELGLKVIVDMVPNHSSDEHEWFKAALAAGPGSAERERYMFREGRGEHGELPPNNWESVFGGAAWTRVTEADGRPGQWYLHIFDTKQPDFNWEHPEVRAEFESILRFWLDRGVDGFRVDVAHGLIKEQGLPDTEEERTTMLGHAEHEGEPRGRARTRVGRGGAAHRPHEAQPDVGPGRRPRGLPRVAQDPRVLRRRPTASSAPRPGSSRRSARCAYVRPDEMHQAFNFDFLTASWIAEDLRAVITSSLHAADSVGAPSTWVLSNHDVVRHASRLGYAPGTPRMNGISATDPQPDRALGLRRARAATALMLALPGGAYIYQGEELGLPDSTDMPAEFRQDPTFARTAGAETGRDGCRVPIPWSATAPSLGFGPSDQHVAAAARRLRRLRRGPPGGRGRLDARALPRAARRPSRAVPRDRLADVGRGVCRRRRRADQRLVPARPGARRRQPRRRARRRCRRAPRSSSPRPRSRTASCRPT